MSIPASVIAKMAALGLNESQAEAVAAMLSAVEAATREEVNAVVEKGKEKARARLQRWREKNGNVSKRFTTSGNGLRGDERVEDNLQTKNQAGQEEKKERTAPAARAFADFWAIYPHKVGKRDAEKAFASALQRASLEAILAGVRRYAAKTDDRPWCNPSTFLNQNRWEDEPAVPMPRSQAHSPPERTVSQALAEMAAGTWTGPKDTRQNEPTLIDITSYSRFAR